MKNNKPIITWAYAAKLIHKIGPPGLSPEFTRSTAKGVREAMASYCNVSWDVLRKEGWRVVRVKITETRP